MKIKGFFRNSGIFNSGSDQGSSGLGSLVSESSKSLAEEKEIEPEVEPEVENESNKIENPCDNPSESFEDFDKLSWSNFKVDLQFVSN